MFIIIKNLIGKSGNVISSEVRVIPLYHLKVRNSYSSFMPEIVAMAPTLV